MPRFLWLGLVVCAVGLLAALVFVRVLEPGLDVDHGVADARPDSPVARVDLIAAQDVELGVRAPAEAARPAESAQTLAENRLALERKARRAERPRPVKPPPKFETGVIEVRVVRDHDSQPLLGVSVELRREGKRDVQTTDLGGGVVFTNVVEGRSTLTATLAGHVRARGEATIARDVPYANVELRLIAEREVVVRLRDPAGRPFDPDAWHLDRRATGRIGVRLDSRCGRVGSTFAAADVLQYTARSSEPDLGAYMWRMRIHRAAEICVHALLDDVIVGVAPLDPLATELDVRLDTTAIEALMAPTIVRVLAEVDGVPIAGALIELERVGAPRLPSIQTGIDGRALVSMAATPSPRLLVKARGYATTQVSLTRPYPPEFVVRMPPGRRIAGRVVDRDGEALASALVELHTMPIGDDAPNMLSGPGGEFEFVDTTPAAYRIAAVYADDTVELNVDCRERDVIDLELKVLAPRVDPSPWPR